MVYPTIMESPQPKIEQLSLLIAAQKGHRQAIAKLCKSYEALIRKYASTSPVKIVYSDMENELWCQFLRALKEYDHRSEVPFAGFIKSRIKFAQYNLFKKLRNQWQREQCILTKEFHSDRKLDNNALSLEDILDPVPSAESNFLEHHVKHCLRLAFQRLEPKQQDILKAIYMEDCPLSTLGQKYNISRQAMFKHKKRALAALSIHFKEVLNHDSRH